MLPTRAHATCRNTQEFVTLWESHQLLAEVFLCAVRAHSTRYMYALADYHRVDVLVAWYKSVNFRGRNSTASLNRQEKLGLRQVLHEMGIQRLYGNEFYNTNSSILLIKNILCSKLHGQRVSIAFPFHIRSRHSAVLGRRGSRGLPSRGIKAGSLQPLSYPPPDIACTTWPAPRSSELLPLAFFLHTR